MATTAAITASPVVSGTTSSSASSSSSTSSLSSSTDQLRRAGAHTAPPETYPRRFLAVGDLLVASTDETVVLIDPLRAVVLDQVRGALHKG